MREKRRWSSTRRGRLDQSITSRGLGLGRHRKVVSGPSRQWRSDPGPREAWTLGVGRRRARLLQALGCHPIVLGLFVLRTVDMTYATRHRRIAKCPREHEAQATDLERRVLC